MVRYKVPDETNSLALNSDPNLRYFVAVEGKLLPIFQKMRAGDHGVKAFIPSAPGVAFSVGVYNGRDKMLKSTMRLEMWYGEMLVCQWVMTRKDFDPKTTAVDDDRRFSIAASVMVGEHHSRTFQFADIPKTDADGAAKLDMEYLDKVSAIALKAYWLTDSKEVADKIPAAVQPQGKKRAKTDSQSKAPAAKSEKGKRANVPKDDLSDDPLVRHNKNLQPIDETSDKGIFGLAPGFGELVCTRPKEPASSNAGNGTTDVEKDSSDLSADEEDDAYSPSTSSSKKKAGGGRGSSAQKSAAPKQVQVRKRWQYKEKVLHTTATFYLRSLPWISDFLYQFFFKPTPVLPPPEPTVQIGDVLYVDTSEQDAQADANASGPPKKRTKLTSGPGDKTSKGAQAPNDDDDAEMQDGEYGGHDHYDWNSDWNNGPDDALQLLAATAAQRPRPVSAASEEVKVTSTVTQQGAVPNGSGAKVPPVALTDATAPTPIGQSAAAPSALPQSAAASNSAGSDFEVAARAPVASTSAPLSSREIGEAGADNTSSNDDVNFTIDTPAVDLLAASNYASNAASNLFRRMVKQDPQLGLLAEQTVLALPSQAPSIPTQQPAAQIDASCRVGSSRDLQSGASSSLATSHPARMPAKPTKTFQSRQARKPASTNGAPIGGMPYRPGGPSGGKPSLKK